MLRRRTNLRWVLCCTLGWFLSLAIVPAFAQNVSAMDIGPAHSQGATITKKYFIYTVLDDDGYTAIYRCNRNGTNISGCKSIAGGNFGHANVIDHEWGSNYFRVEGGGCFTLSGKSASSSKCLSNPANWSNDSGGLTGQGRTQYGEYRLKAFGSTHGSNSRIVVRQKQKNGNYKTIKVIKLGSKPFVTQRGDGSHYSPEIEDVMVDGDTGTIYYSMSGCYNDACLWGEDGQEVRLYKYSGYKLPKAGSNTPIKTAKEQAKQKAKQKAKEKTNKSKESSSGNKSSGGTTSGNTDKTNSSGIANSTGSKECIKTNVLGSGGEYCDDGNGGGVKHILQLVLDIMTIGIGILGVLGIVIVGIQYLTAGGNEEKTRKAKRRLLEIVIGLVAYVLIYAILGWLLP